MQVITIIFLSESHHPHISKLCQVDIWVISMKRTIEKYWLRLGYHRDKASTWGGGEYKISNTKWVSVEYGSDIEGWWISIEIIFYPNHNYYQVFFYCCFYGYYSDINLILGDVDSLLKGMVLILYQVWLTWQDGVYPCVS